MTAPPPTPVRPLKKPPVAPVSTDLALYHLSCGPSPSFSDGITVLDRGQSLAESFAESFAESRANIGLPSTSLASAMPRK